MKGIQNDIEVSIQASLSQLVVLKKKTILITGGTGFMGSWVARTLAWLNDEKDFACNIILLARAPDKLVEVDAKLLQRKDVQFIGLDIRSLGDLPKGIDYILHAAASPDNRMHMSDPVTTMDVITTGTKSVLEASLRLEDVKGIVHVSSGQVYSSSLGSDLSEGRAGSNITGNITSVYPEAKRFAEAICSAYRHQYKLPISIVRPFSFVGPYQALNKPWAINSFIQEGLSGQAIRIVGNGKPKRSYMYASDMAVWLLVILGNGKRGGTYNVGSSDAVSLLEVANKVNSSLPQQVELIIQNYNSDESVFVPDTKLATKHLDLILAFKFNEGLERTIRWNLEQKDKS